MNKHEQCDHEGKFFSLHVTDGHLYVFHKVKSDPDHEGAWDDVEKFKVDYCPFCGYKSED